MWLNNTKRANIYSTNICVHTKYMWITNFGEVRCTSKRACQCPPKKIFKHIIRMCSRSWNDNSRGRFKWCSPRAWFFRRRFSYISTQNRIEMHLKGMQLWLYSERSNFTNHHEFARARTCICIYMHVIDNRACNLVGLHPKFGVMRLWPIGRIERLKTT